MLSESSYHCRICGLRSEEPPWGSDGRSPLFDFCPCCGVEHGYQDATRTGALRFRSAWLQNGAKWDYEPMKPQDWHLDEQMARIPSEFKP
jgi:hypothetical protein